MNKELIEQKAKEIADKNEKYHIVYPSQEDCYKSAIDMANWLLNNIWISVEDELPTIGEEIFIAYTDSDGHINYDKTYRVDREVSLLPTNTDDNGFIVYGMRKVTHWMYIPKIKK